MNWIERVEQARAHNHWQPLVEAVPFARFLGLSIDVKGEEFTCILPYREMLIGNPILPALHGGATGGFLECAALFYLLWRMESTDLPRTIDFNIDYLRSGRPRDTFANVHMVKQGTRVANLRIEAWQTTPQEPIALAHGNFLLRNAVS
ncbi:PaaI family thioesterase [Tepidiphilus olei]|uniref:PaaI family thioesterase n=1 Tax=Tepidiphilus olei TaxID=2502184 RepID=UPI00115F35DE|nr:PaaI family thioesterase [Tepidiphilus olei]